MTKVLTPEELTGTKIGASKVVVDKIVELDVALTADDILDLRDEEEVYKLVDEVVDTSISDT